MLEDITERALDNIDTYGFHLPVCLGHSPTGENIYIIAEPREGEKIDFRACAESVSRQTRQWIAEGKLRAVAIATVVTITVDDDRGGTRQTAAVKILLDHVDLRGYAAYVTFQKQDGKATAGQIIYQNLTETWFPSASTSE